MLKDEVMKLLSDKIQKELIDEIIVPKSKRIARSAINRNSSGHGIYSTGALVDSISAEKIGDNTFKIGTHGIEYASIVDQGRGPVRPVNAKALYNPKGPFGPTKYASETRGAHIVDAWKSEIKGD